MHWLRIDFRLNRAGHFLSKTNFLKINSEKSQHAFLTFFLIANHYAYLIIHIFRVKLWAFQWTHHKSTGTFSHSDRSDSYCILFRYLIWIFAHKLFVFADSGQTNGVYDAHTHTNARVNPISCHKWYCFHFWGQFGLNPFNFMTNNK